MIVFALENRTVFDNPIHPHGHIFRIVSPRPRVDIAFVADNPGAWMFHCHFLSHQMAELMSVSRVA